MVATPNHCSSNAKLSDNELIRKVRPGTHTHFFRHTSVSQTTLETAIHSYSQPPPPLQAQQISTHKHTHTHIHIDTHTPKQPQTQANNLSGPLRAPATHTPTSTAQPGPAGGPQPGGGSSAQLTCLCPSLSGEQRWGGGATGHHFCLVVELVSSDSSGSPVLLCSLTLYLSLTISLSIFLPPSLPPSFTYPEERLATEDSVR